MWRNVLLGGLLATALASTGAAQPGFAACPQFFVGGKVPVVSRAPELRRELCFDSFAILHSGQSKTPLFGAERLNRSLLLDAKGEERTDRFYEEARLPRAERAALEDYKAGLLVQDPDDSTKQVRVKVDRGHVIAAGDMPNARAMAQSFSLANMMPQAPQNNRRTWKDIESATRKYAMRATGDVFVFTGPVFAGPVRTLATGQVWVPSHLYKLVYDQTSNRAWAHWLENTDTARAGRPISYEELVRRTGIDFLPGVRPSS
ncbi:MULTISPECIES: DNA/RNA non-specific endonuclease [unclassified Variovorax]|uniref:DNA/RNA non-specific endonuclease n=1 Tax=unclassified Variovorax TaxID=663243 RepID=UPI001318CA75|nr:MULTISPECIES: DNA/RNA non-specific endonuclease [unclassified Variovorax]VTU41883.1 Nuclease precursor [Variovorax sp. PBL-H6]VTU44459.1 Nuclease precursor [Variovorax sp. SRS16]VTU44504.1 Nuclease precursor [Variovorax sp. PBL-E5]